MVTNNFYSMKIQCTTVLKALEVGKNIKVSESEELTVGKAIATMLITPRQNGPAPLDMVKAYVLAQKFYVDKEVELDASDAGHLKDFINADRNYGPIVTGQIMVMLFPAVEEKKEEVKEEEK